MKLVPTTTTQDYFHLISRGGKKIGPLYNMEPNKYTTMVNSESSTDAMTTSMTTMTTTSSKAHTAHMECAITIDKEDRGDYEDISTDTSSNTSTGILQPRSMTTSSLPRVTTKTTMTCATTTLSSSGLCVSRPFPSSSSSSSAAAAATAPAARIPFLLPSPSWGRKENNEEWRHHQQRWTWMESRAAEVADFHTKISKRTTKTLKIRKEEELVYRRMKKKGGGKKEPLHNKDTSNRRRKQSLVLLEEIANSISYEEIIEGYEDVPIEGFPTIRSALAEAFPDYPVVLLRSYIASTSSTTKNTKVSCGDIAADNSVTTATTPYSVSSSLSSFSTSPSYDFSPSASCRLEGRDAGIIFVAEETTSEQASTQVCSIGSEGNGMDYASTVIMPTSTSPPHLATSSGSFLEFPGPFPHQQSSSPCSGSLSTTSPSSTTNSSSSPFSLLCCSSTSQVATHRTPRKAGRSPHQNSGGKTTLKTEGYGGTENSTKHSDNSSKKSCSTEQSRFVGVESDNNIDCKFLWKQDTTSAPSFPPYVDPHRTIDCSLVTNYTEGLLEGVRHETGDEFMLLSRLILGRWETLLHRSNPLEPLFKSFGISYIKRVVVDRLAIPLTITLQGVRDLDMLIHLPIGNRHMRWALDGSRTIEDDPDCGTWRGYVRSVELDLSWVEGSCRALQQVRTHAKIGEVHETRAVLPDDKHGRILYLNFALFPKSNPSDRVNVTRILKPIK